MSNFYFTQAIHTSKGKSFIRKPKRIRRESNTEKNIFTETGNISLKSTY